MGQMISKNANGGYDALEKSKSGTLSQTFLNLSIYHSQEFWFILTIAIIDQVIICITGSVATIGGCNEYTEEPKKVPPLRLIALSSYEVRSLQRIFSFSNLVAQFLHTNINNFVESTKMEFICSIFWRLLWLQIEFSPQVWRFFHNSWLLCKMKCHVQKENSEWGNSENSWLPILT